MLLFTLNWHMNYVGRMAQPLVTLMVCKRFTLHRVNVTFLPTPDTIIDYDTLAYVFIVRAEVDTKSDHYERGELFNAALECYKKKYGETYKMARVYVGLGQVRCFCSCIHTNEAFAVVQSRWQDEV